MNSNALKSSITEAERFLEKAKALRKVMDEDEKLVGSFHIWDHPKESGAVRRASMDLTRALAELRR